MDRMSTNGAGPRLDRLRLVGDRLTTVGLALFAFGVWLGPAVSNLGLVLLLLVFAADPRAWRWALASRLLWLCVVAAGFVAARAYLAAVEMPDSAEQQWKEAVRWIQLLLFGLVAWPLWQRPSRVRWAAMLAAAGLVVGTLVALVSPEGTREAWLEGRFGGYMAKPIAFAFYASVVLLGLAVFCGPTLMLSAKPMGGRRLALFALLWSVLLLLTWAFLASQSRGPLLAAVAVIPLAMVWRYRIVAWMAGVGRGGVLIGGVLLALLLAVLVSPQMDRVQGEAGAIFAIVEQGLDSTPLNSATLRLHMWEYGLRKWAERPLLGWGPGSVEPLLAASGQHALNYLGQPWDHLHNAYVQVLLTLGAVGALLFLGIVAGLLRSLWQRYRAGEVGREETIFLVCNFLLIAIYSITDFRHLNPDWRMYWLLLAGMTFALGRGASEPARAYSAADAPLTAR